MTKVLLTNPNKWGRGITHIWISTHSSILKKNHEVELFDCTFYSDWTDDEFKYSTSTGMFKLSDYGRTDIIYQNILNRLIGFNVLKNNILNRSNKFE